MNIIRKVVIGIFVVGITFISFENLVSDDFEYCQRYFLTDKETYHVGDTILLTAVIVPKYGKKTIKIFRDFSNLWFNASYKFKDNTPDSIRYIIDWRRDTTKKRYQDKTYNKIVITKINPYRHTFRGVFSYDKLTKLYKINFKDYGYSFYFSKLEYDYFGSFGFDGIWDPVRPIIGASLEESIAQKTIRLEL